MFQTGVSEFLKDTIQEPDLKGVSCVVLFTQGEKLGGRNRRLDFYDYLYMRLSVEGIVSGDDDTTNETFTTQVNKSFDSESTKLVDDLQNSAKLSIPDSQYFHRIDKIESVRGEIGDQINPGDINGNAGNENRSSTVPKSHASIIIAAIASVGAVILFALAVFGFVNRKRFQGYRFKGHGKDFDTGSSYDDEPSPKSSNMYSDSDHQRWDFEQGQAIPARIASRQYGNDDNVTESGNTYSTLDRLHAADAADNASYQSYGYSLEDGIGSKQMSPPSLAERPAPMEVDMYGLQQQARYVFAEDDDATIEVSIGSPGSTYSGLTDLGTQASFEPSGRFSRVLPSGERTSPTKKIAAKKPPLSPTRQTNKVYQRDCVAPPGKLGVVIDTTKHGPVVHMVKEGSPLEHVVFPGDKILSIDEVDTRGMTASGVTRVMAKKMHNQRTITVSSTQKSQFL